MALTLEHRSQRLSLIARVLECALHDPVEVPWAFVWGDSSASVSRIVWDDVMLLCARFERPGSGDEITLYVRGEPMFVRPVDLNNRSRVVFWAFRFGD